MQEGVYFIDLPIGTEFYLNGEKRVVTQREACTAEDCPECDFPFFESNCRIALKSKVRKDGKCIYFKRVQENERS